MLAGFLAGSLKVAAVFAVTAGMGGGVYLLTQAGDDENSSNLQAPEVTATVDASLTPATATSAQAPTGTVAPPQPTATPSGIDTSNWKTYESPLDYSIKYPPGWELIDYSSQGAPLGTVKIFNERAQASPGSEVSGSAWIEIVGDAYPEFDAQFFYQICGVAPQVTPDDGPEPGTESGVVNRASEVEFAGMRAIECLQNGPTVDGTGQISVRIVFMELPSRKVSTVATYEIKGDGQAANLLSTALDTLSLNPS